MKKGKGSLVAAMLGLSLVATPAQACWTSAEQDAARIANMNQMLMVSALRCRFGKNNFLDSYNKFVTRNNGLLASQHQLIKSHYAKTMGEKGAVAQLDRFMIGLANHYGGGMGNPDCASLESFSHHLSRERHDSISLARLAEEQVGLPKQAMGACGVTIASRK